MRRTHLVGAVAVASVAFLAYPRPALDGRLFGTWATDRTAFAPHAVTFHPDGTGMDASGVGNFPFRWKSRGTSADGVRVRVKYTGDAIGAFGDMIPGGGEYLHGRAAHDWEIVFTDADTIQFGRDSLHRQP